CRRLNCRENRRTPSARGGAPASTSRRTFSEVLRTNTPLCRANRCRTSPGGKRYGTARPHFCHFPYPCFLNVLFSKQGADAIARPPCVLMRAECGQAEESFAVGAEPA